MSIKRPTTLKDGKVEGSTIIDVTEDITTTVDVNADNINATGVVNADSVSATQAVSGDTVSAAGAVSGNTVSASTTVSAPSINGTDISATTSVHSSNLIASDGEMHCPTYRVDVRTSPTLPVPTGNDINLINDAGGVLVVVKADGKQLPIGPTLWKKKTLSADFPSGGVVTDFHFDVPVGYVYRITTYTSWSTTGVGRIQIWNGGLTQDYVANLECAATSTNATATTNVTYVRAFYTELDFIIGGIAGQYLKGQVDSGSAARPEREHSYVLVEQMPHHPTQPESW